MTTTNFPDRVALTATGTGTASDVRPLRTFAAIALPTGWVMLTLPLILGLPPEPFVLLTTALGLVLPAVVLTRRDPEASMRGLLRDSVRLPRPRAWLLPAVLLLPGMTWLLARAGGVDQPLDGALLGSLAVNVVSSVVIINLWEEMAWTGFAQRRAIARWGFARGSVLVAALFAGIHLPLVFYDVESVGDVGLNVAVLFGSAVGLRLLIAGFDLWTAGSLLSIALLHASFNVSSELLESDYDWVRYAVVLGLGLVVLGVHRSRSTAA